ncbi:hypothetical protein IJJ97_00300 [bacterium]|nr:hypothetical protein [bacterium]
MICPKCGFEFTSREETCPSCEYKFEQKDYQEYYKKVIDSQDLPTFSFSEFLNIMKTGKKDATSIFVKKFFILFFIVLDISILIVIGSFVPPLGHFFDYCGKLFDDFWRLFGLEPIKEYHRRGDLRGFLTMCIIFTFLAFYFKTPKK